MHKLFVPNDWKVHDIYEYNNITRTYVKDKFQCKAGVQPDYSDLEVYYANRSAAIDYTFITSMSTIVFDIIEACEKYPHDVRTNNYYYTTFKRFLDAVFTIASAQNDTILIADYPDRLVFKLPLIQEYNEYIESYYEFAGEDIQDKIAILSDRVEITIRREYIFTEQYMCLYDTITKYGEVLSKTFCKKTAIVNTDTFEIVDDNYIEMDLCTAEISCRRPDKELAENEAEIDKEIIPALVKANKVARNLFGGKTKYSCCGHSFDLFSGYVLFTFERLNRCDRGMDYFVSLLEKSSEEHPEFEDYFYAEVNGNRLTVRFDGIKALELAATMKPEEVVRNIVNKFIEMMDYIDKHKNDEPDKLSVPM